ncbi:hypothetical protein MGYG_01574 [Nannizzia gypsea CBS 118893]|uniref:Uncharacterized protein n=1 Tax=Arthroderma gypseum (strain ATCC MYA-4604 / CBS 118893) TaxID=535722 RepID=E5R1R3_ARTGP|nr:hypothetical protein MGYG_01574 [Nannizzia gypsea CBS 118893]EFQ98547.1 hypothetical protein MGYG_01574 [Nannizzia gypsea CBS 118893]
MESLIRNSVRVIRNVDNVDQALQAFSGIEEKVLSGNIPSITEQDRRRILDFPEPDVMESNIAKVSGLSTEDLLKLGAESPTELTDSELLLLNNRFWTFGSGTEDQPQFHAFDALLAVSEAHFLETIERLDRVRDAFYTEHETKALSNSWTEQGRRHIVATKEKERKDLENLPKTHPWVRSMWEGGYAKKHWGYAVYKDPATQKDERDVENYECRRSALIHYALGMMSCPYIIETRWKMQTLQWPAGVESEEHGGKGVKELTARFNALREHFKAVRDLEPETRQTKTGGLFEGLLKNVFLVLNSECVRSEIAHIIFADDTWVWAVDADYIPSKEDNNAESQHAYMGYMRVRLQQLVHNFYNARLFHAEEHPMKLLWEAAQVARNQAFVSLDSDESRRCCPDANFGTSLVPK